MVASNLSDNSCHLSLIGFVSNLTYKLTHQDVTRFKMEHTVSQLWCSQRYLSWSQKTDTRSLFELDKNPLIKMMLRDSRCDVLCDNSDAARDFCWPQKPNRRSLSELDKNPLIKMMLQDSRCNISGFLSYADRVVEVFGRFFHRSVQQHSICFNLMIFRPWNPPQTLMCLMLGKIRKRGRQEGREIWEGESECLWIVPCAYRATETAATRRGWVTATMPFAVYPALYRIWASCVVLPEPVSPMITTTVLLAMASRIGPSYWLIGSTLFFLFSSSSIAIPTMHNACSSKATGILQPFPAFARATPLNPQKRVNRFLASSTISSAYVRKKQFAAAGGTINALLSNNNPRLREFWIRCKASRQRRFRA